MSVSRGQLSETFEDYGIEFYVEFKVKIYETPKEEWANILHVTNGGNCCSDGNRLPAIWLNKNLYFLVVSAINGNPNYGFDFKFEGVQLNFEYHVVVSQQYNANKDLIYLVKINDKILRSIKNTKPITISSALLYLSDPWYSSIQEVGQMYDLFVIPGPVGGMELDCSSTTTITPLICNENFTSKFEPDVIFVGDSIIKDTKEDCQEFCQKIVECKVSNSYL